MKRPLTRTLSLFLSLVLILGTVTLCWFSLPDTVDFPTSFGSANAAYFESGDGSASDPYIISQPVHLYNLAWLQYLGYFNLNPSLNNGRAQSYFKLKNNIVMTNVAIPPIGTEEYPFIGKFDGNHKTIGSLTVSNSFADLTRHPTAAVFDAETSAGKLQTAGSDTSDASKMTEVAIVGLFGVTGDYGSAIGSGENTDYSGKTIYQYTDPDAKEKTLVPLPTDLTAITVNDLYYASMFVGNFYTDRLHVRSASVKTLIGLVAGYVGGGFENVGVYRADITMTKGVSALKEDDSSGIVSKYTLVGDYDTSAVGWSEEPKGTGEGGWGGSLDMRTLARRMNYMLTKTGITTASTDDSVQITVSSYNNIVLANNSNYRFKARVGTNGTIKNMHFDYTAYNAVGTAAVNIYAGLVSSDSYMPLNVDLSAMGLDVEDNITETVTVYQYTKATAPYARSTTTAAYSWNINDKYKEQTSEILSSSNAGYIVGMKGNTGSVPAAQIYVEMRELGSYLSNSVGTSYDDSKLTLYKVTGNGTQEAIIDTINTGDKVPNYSNLLLDPNKYIAMREKTGSQALSNFLGGNNGLLYGIFFQNTTNTQYALENINSYSTIETAQINGTAYTNYEVIPGAINFSVKEVGVVSSIWGTMSNTSANHKGAFDIYQVQRNKDNAITSVTKISTVYKNNGTYEINPTNPTGTCVYNEAWYGDGKLEAEKAYYVEIPLPAGDYAIGMKYSSSDIAARIMYLDIGANGDTGSDSSTAMPYLMQRVDFINDSSVDAEGRVTVPSETDSTGGASYRYPQYADVILKLSGVGQTGDAVIVVKRATGTSTNSNGEINTTLQYRVTSGSVVVTPLPSELAENDSTLSKEDDESG